MTSPAATRANPDDGRGPATRLRAGAWLALAYTSLIIAAVVMGHTVVWRTPTDGWAARPASNTGDVEPGSLLQADVLGLSEDLRAGDVVVAIDGERVIDYARASYAWPPPAEPAFSDGQVVRYTVQRGSDRVDVDVRLRRLSPLQHILGSLKMAVGVNDPVAAALEVIASIAFSAISVFLFVRRPRERAAHALLIMGTPFFFQHTYLVPSTTSWSVPSLVRYGLAFEPWIWAFLPSLVYLTLAFPRPKWPIRRLGGLGVALIYGAAIAIQLLPAALYPTDYDAAMNLLQKTLGLALLYVVLPVVALVHSFITVRDPGERAQLKWFGVGVLGFVLGGVAFTVAGKVGWNLPLSVLQNGGYLALPVCLAIAVVRARLFDIDLVIRRTLVYALLTALLAAVYFGGVTLLQRLFGAVTGQQSTVAIVISTLAIAALFNPLRSRIQEFVDRRFYRRQYDGPRVLAGFASASRDETDLETLAGSLAAAVQETVQPAQVAVWLQDQQGSTG